MKKMNNFQLLILAIAIFAIVPSCMNSSTEVATPAVPFVDSTSLILPVDTQKSVEALTVVPITTVVVSTATVVPTNK